ncbi:MAG: hypothetical protein SFY80_14775 [Verrucomicrobiota bacterium]|nr:hypothetical protein [Verrucomicrobiota bacterium]
MKRRTLWLVSGVLFLSLILSGWATTQVNDTEVKKEAKAGEGPGAKLAETLTQVTGVAISPLLGMSAVGAYEYIKAPSEKRAGLPWYCHPLVFSAGIVLVGACAMKDTLGTVVPAGLKKPLDVLETFENKASGLVATAAFVPFTVSQVGSYITESVNQAVAIHGGGALAPLATIDFAPFLSILMIPLAMAVFVLVWLVSHAINVLILLSPFAAVDAALKSIRISVLGLLTLTSTINPWAGAVLSIVLIVVAYLLWGWAFRLSVFGTVFVWDYLSFGRTRCKPTNPTGMIFTARKIQDVPIRSSGRLTKNADGTLTFTYRPLLVMRPRTLTLPKGNYAIGKGLLFSTILEDDPTTPELDFRNIFTLPPRYLSHEAALAACLGLGVEDVGLRKRAKSVVRFIKHLFGMGRGTDTAVIATASV